MSVRVASKRPRRGAVTIVISFRERWRLTVLTVASILRHTRGNFALWLLDPGMPDSVRNELKPYIDAGRLELVTVAPGLQPIHWRAEIAPKLSAPYAVFIDNDVVVTPGWLDRMVDCAEETGAGIVCPLYLWGDHEQSDVIHMAGGKLGLVPTDHGLRMTESHRHVNRTIADVADDLSRKVCGFGEYHCLLMRREVYSAEGIFDPGIVTVHEHIHASMRARELGFETWFEPEAKVNYLAFAEWYAGELREFRSRWDFATAERSLAQFARRWKVIDDRAYRTPIRQFLTGHAGRSDVLDPRPNLGERRQKSMGRADLEPTFAGLQWLAQDSGYESNDIMLLRRAYGLATALTAGLYRPCGRPFINHLAGTASILLFYGCPLPHVLAGLLHAAHTHGPKQQTRQWLERFAGGCGQAKTAARLATLYADRSKLLKSIDLDGEAIDRLPVQLLSLCLLDAANEIEMRLSLEVAVSGRTDILGDEHLRKYQMVLEHVGLPGMAATLEGLGKDVRRAPAVPFRNGQTVSFSITNAS